MRSWIPRPGALATALVLILTGCSADETGIVVLSARAPGDNCDFKDDTLYVSRGSLDLRPYYEVDPALDPTAQPVVTTRYYQVFSWENNLRSVPLSVGTQVVDPGAGNNFIADSVTYQYQYSDPSLSLAAETANMHAVIAAGGTTADNSVPTDLVQPNAAAALKGSALSGPQTLLVTFQIFGNVAAGGTRKSTNKVTFPLTIYRSSTTPLNCFAGGTVPNGGKCKTVGRDQDVSCGTP